VIRFTSWRPQHPEEEPIDYNRSTPTEYVRVIRNQLHGEERARSDRQLEAHHAQLAEIGKHHLATQKLPIGNPDPVPKRQRIVQKKSHGRADARGLTDAELADRALIAKERAKKEEQQPAKRGRVRVSTPDEEEGPILMPATPPRSDWESRGETTITLALGSPRRPLRGPEGLPTSTAPPRLAGEGTDAPRQEGQAGYEALQGSPRGWGDRIYNLTSRIALSRFLAPATTSSPARRKVDENLRTAAYTNFRVVVSEIAPSRICVPNMRPCVLSFGGQCLAIVNHVI
jgi:hypothetical protein